MTTEYIFGLIHNEFYPLQLNPNEFTNLIRMNYMTTYLIRISKNSSLNDGAAVDVRDG